MVSPRKMLTLLLLTLFAITVVFIIEASYAGGEPNPAPQVPGSSVPSAPVDRITVSEPDMVMAMAAEAGRRQQEAEVAAYLAAMEAALRAQRAVPRSAPGFDYPASCEGHTVPAYILWRESHCNYGSVNVTGCGGYSCVGMYQFDLRHWLDGGGCAWLGDWTVPANQDACADQMSRGGTNLSAWGG